MEFFDYKGITLDKVNDVTTIRFDMSQVELCKEIIKEKNIKCLRINRNPGKIDNLNFLKDNLFKDIETVSISVNWLKDITGLYALENLKSFSFVGVIKDLKIDFEMLPSLTRVSLDWSNKYTNLDKLTNLEFLRIIKYPYKDLKCFKYLRELKYLEFNESKLISLEGIDYLTNVEEIQLHYNRSLQSLKGISKNFKRLKRINIYSAPKLYEVSEYLSNAVNLKGLLLSKTPNIDSLKFLDKMTKLKSTPLKHHYFNSIGDNDFSPLDRLLQRLN